MSNPSPAAAPDGNAGDPLGGSQFPPTQWSLVLRAGAETDTQARTALESLCRSYWQPLYAFVRRQGRDHHEAEDATQQFIAQLLAADGLQRARPQRGRFRTFLLSGLRNFLTSEWRRSSAAKRGGGIAPLRLETSAALDQSIVPDLEDTRLTPARAFDRAWALNVIERAVADLRAEYQRSDREAVFEVLAPLIWGHDASAETLAQHAARLHMTTQTFTVALHRARRRLGERLRALVAETVADPADIDGELRHLVRAVTNEAGSG